MKSLSEQELRDRWKTPEGKEFQRIILEQLETSKWVNWSKLSVHINGRNIRWVDFEGVSEVKNLATETTQTIVNVYFNHTEFTLYAKENIDYGDLRGMFIQGRRFKDTFMSGLHLNHSIIMDCQFTNTDFFRSMLDNAMISRTTFNQCVLADINFRNGFLDQSKVLNSSLIQSDLSYTDFNLTNFTGTDLSKSKFVLKSWFWRIKEIYRLTKDVKLNKPNRLTGTELRGARLVSEPVLYRLLLDEQYLDDFSQKNRRLYKFWLLTSNCGRSISLLFGWSIAIAVFFGFVFADLSFPNNVPVISNFLNIIDPQFTYDGMPQTTIWQPIYLSFVTMTTLGVGSVEPMNTAAFIWHIILNIIGYGWLGYLISVLGSKLTRRSA